MLPDIETLGTVVVCEDDEPTLKFICDNLTADRYEAIAAPTAADALRHCRYGQPDLLLLDLRLPDASGLDVLHELRSSGQDGRFDPELPVMVLSGFSADQERVRGLRAGADDYLVKPIHYNELLLRIGNLLRRRRGSKEGPRRVGELVLDPATRRVTFAGKDISLANKEFCLLRALIADPNRVFSKEELLRDVWGYRSMGRTRTLDSHASRVRRKLADAGGTFIVNCWGVGYRLLDS